MVFSCKT